MLHIVYMSDPIHQRQRGNDSGKDHKINAFINELFKKKRKGSLTSDDIRKIKEQFNDSEMVDYIQERFIERQTEIERKAKKFARRIERHYGDRKYPLHILLKKALKYKNKSNMSHDEFEAFRRFYQNSLFGTERSGEIGLNHPRTKLSKFLNTTAYPYENSDGLNLKEKDYGIMQDIIKTHRSTEMNHRNVALQSLTYKDCAIEALTGQYHHRFNPMCHVHPVVAALFLPKFNRLDEHMILSNIAHIFKCKHENKPITNQVDTNLLFHLVTDPNDIVCSERSAIEDIRARVNIQVNLWNSVYALRNGMYYDCNFNAFVDSIRTCKFDTIDSPDIMYSGEEGMVLKTLFAAFSYRPTLVTSMTIAPYQISSNPLNTIQTQQPEVHTIPMVTFRLPPSQQANESISLTDSLKQPQYQIENGVLVPKLTDIIYSQEIIVFYVNRRYQNLNFHKHLFPTHPSQTFNKLPSVLSSLEKINTRKIEFEPTIQLGDATFSLRSVVVADTKEIGTDHLITGCSTILIDNNNSHGTPLYMHYNPKDAHKIVAGQDGQPVANERKFEAPITRMDDFDDGGPTNFVSLAEHTGTVYIYQDTNVNDPTNDADEALVALLSNYKT